MVKSDENKLIFIHIPKCGGTSVEHLLCQQKTKFIQLSLYFLENKHDIVHQYIMNLFYYSEFFRRCVIYLFNLVSFVSGDKYDFANNSRYMNHKPIHLYKNIPNCENYKKVAFVRNPYSRLISAYKHLYIRKRITFEEFCIKVAKDTEKLKKDVNFIINIFFIPQVFFIQNPDITIIKLENVKNEWINYIMSNKLDLECNIAHNNKTKDQKIFITLKSIKIINKVYHEDFLKLNYEKLKVD